jgi:hypothetical protein
MERKIAIKNAFGFLKFKNLKIQKINIKMLILHYFVPKIRYKHARNSNMKDL